MKTRRRAMGQAGLQRMRNLFSFERFEREIRALLDEMLGSPSPRWQPDA